MPEVHIIYVEDDESLGFVTKDNLEMQGYRVSHFNDGAIALDHIKVQAYDMAILDVMLPEIDGFELARQLRARNRDIPILFLSAKSMKEDRLQGFSVGADDYITKPFSIEELVFKIQVFLKRSKVQGPTDRKVLPLGHYRLDYPNLQLKLPDGALRTLTQKESDVLKFLLDRKNEVIRRSVILEQIWGEDDYFMGRSLDVFISRLRKYLADDDRIQIENIHGVGFKLRLDEEA